MSNDTWGDKDKNPAQNALESLKEKENHGRDWRLIEGLVNGLFKEQKTARRWGVFFKSLTFLYLFAILAFYFVTQHGGQDSLSDGGEHTAIIELVGPIAASADASADMLVASLRRAFRDENTKAVILRINSPGGSPVQSGYVYDEIKRLRVLHPDTKLYAVISDIGASGAYYIASAADYIYADKASLVGSIGVISSGFGFVGLMEKLGVERRALSSGENKTFLDPFSPLKDTDREFWQTVLSTTHEQFIDQVKKGRGDRLIISEDLFSGLIWTGEQALEKGLIDGLGSSSYVARDVVGVEKLKNFSPQLSPIEEVIDRLGISFATGLATQLGLNTKMGMQ